MVSLRRLAILMILGAFAGTGSFAQSSSSDAAQQPTQQPTQPPASTPPLTVQARIRARREQRRVAEIHDVYTHLYEAYAGMGYLRFTPGPGLQRVNEYAWNVGVTRYFNERLGVTVDGRGYYGRPFVGLNAISNSANTKPEISQYTAMIGPTYRFLVNPRYSVSGRVLAGGAFGNFSGDLGSFTPEEIGLYSNGASVAVNVSVPLEYNITPGVGFRVAPEYLLTNFGSTTQNSLGFTSGLVFRWGKQ
jgi:hypothetical protein